MDHKHFEEMVALYAVGALEPLERQELENHLYAGCVVCPNLLKDYQETVSLLPHGLTTIEAPPHLKSQIMEKISKTVPQAVPEMANEKRSGLIGNTLRNFATPLFRPAFTLLIVFILAGTGFYALSLRSQLEGTIEQRQEMAEVLDETSAHVGVLRQKLAEQERVVSDLRDKQNRELAAVLALNEELKDQKAELEQLQTQLGEREEESAFLRRVLAQKDDVVRLLLSPDVVVVSLKGLEQSPGSAFLLFDAERKSGLFYSFGLPSLPRGKVYQLWAIVDKPVSVGTFGLDAGRKGRILIKNLTNFSRISKFAVSLEPEGGRPQPTGTIHLMGET